MNSVEDLTVFSCFGIGRVHQNPGNEKGGSSRTFEALMTLIILQPDVLMNIDLG